MSDFVHFWQHLPSSINPNIFQIGSFQVRYYSLMYIVAFALTYFLVVFRLEKEKFPYTRETIQDFMLWAIIGVILGGRLGYVLFYNFDYYLRHLSEIFLPFDFSHGIRFVGISGMSYHGGLVGLLAASVIFCNKYRISFWNIADLFAPAVPLGYTFGRIGNFINGELWGRATTVPWGMYFPLDSSGLLRHPSQLYEAFFEGVLLFAVLWGLRKKRYFEGFFVALYMVGYGLVRFFIEFYREPDAQLGFVIGSLSMGQVLSLLMVIAGVVIGVMKIKPGRKI
ncbi:MAG: prolipoprotein diacylglyceryl transferase [Deltaproteobacteria bacterium]|nr:prolipoprotein diacylglyceryl transferase [Deltaproteobacteria bacterium]